MVFCFGFWVFCKAWGFVFGFCCFVGFVFVLPWGELVFLMLPFLLFFLRALFFPILMTFFFPFCLTKSIAWTAKEFHMTWLVFSGPKTTNSRHPAEPSQKNTMNLQNPLVTFVILRAYLLRRWNWMTRGRIWKNHLRCPVRPTRWV